MSERERVKRAKTRQNAGDGEENNPHLPLAIRCMELNVKEVDSAVRDFRYYVGDITSPSWKYPHMKMEDVDVGEMVNLYCGFEGDRHQDSEKQYIDLTELLIDRLYYSYAAVSKYLRILILELNGGRIGNVNSMWDKDQKQEDELLLADSRPQISDKHINIAVLIRKVYTRLRTLDSNFKKFQKPTHSKGGLLLKTSNAQTDMACVAGCEACVLTQKVLKLVGLAIASCISRFSDARPAITQIREEGHKNLFEKSQWGVTLNWCSALEHDCKTVGETVKDLKSKNQELEIQLEDAVAFSEKTLSDIETLKESYEERIRKLHDNQSDESEEMQKVKQQRDAALAKIKKLQKLVESNELNQVDKGKLDSALRSLDELKEKLVITQERSSFDLNEVKSHLENEMNERKVLTARISSLFEQMTLKDQKIRRLEAEEEQRKGVLQENMELKEQIRELENEVKESRAQLLGMDGLHKNDAEEIARLSTELKKAQEDLELLIMYPDLHGPVTAPAAKTGNCLETMEKQIEANDTRVALLQQQSARLKFTLSKLKDHMDSMSEAEVPKVKVSCPQ